MVVLLLGNGFDLRCGFPTRYIDFLNTVDFLLEHYNPNMKTIGDVFGHQKLRNTSKTISDCYNKYEQAYNEVTLSRDLIDFLVKNADNNLWFRYFLKAKKLNFTWIDFEKQIGDVVSAFKMLFSFFSDHVTPFSLDKITTNPILKEILCDLNFFFEQSDGDFLCLIKSEYLQPHFYLDVKSDSLHKNEILDRLKKEFEVFSDCLRLYLKIFVDNATNKIIQDKLLPIKAGSLAADLAITFNYTNTFERLRPNVTTHHIHGNVDDKIVLGINPDEDDELGSIDTDFIPFKKYYQRVVLGTDYDYLSSIEEFQSLTDQKIDLVVMGHSLDVTDRDIIEALFNVANRISIWYHEQSAMATYLKKLIELFGKKGFDRIRSSKKLQFVSYSVLDQPDTPSPFAWQQFEDCFEDE